MKTFIINLGLGNSPYESKTGHSDSRRRRTAFEQVSYLASQLDVAVRYEWSEGEYEGKAEETMVITLRHPSSTSVNLFARELTRHFTHLCVAVYDVDAERGELVWHDQVVDRPYTLDPSFFIMPTTVRDRITSRLPKA